MNVHDQVLILRDALKRLKIGQCWCGNLSKQDADHSEECRDAQRAMRLTV